VLTTVLFAAAGVWLGSINGYVITSEINHIGPSNPMNKTAAVAAGAWMPTSSPTPRCGWCPVSVWSCR
jgi:cytochrome d ubiquinol oxidase subunit II